MILYVTQDFSPDRSWFICKTTSETPPSPSSEEGKNGERCLHVM